MNKETLVGIDYLSEALEHHGTKGMRWGVRNRVSGGRSSRREAKELKKSDKATSDKWKQTYKNRGNMSDKELQAAVNRLNLEQRLGQMSGSIPQSQKNSGESYMKKMGQQQVVNATNQVTSELVRQGIKVAGTALANR